MGLVVSQLCIDARDPVALARWWQQVLGWRVDEDEDEVALEPPDAATPAWLFLRVPEDKQVKNRLHVDLRPPDGSDQATELDRLLRLGAVPVDVGQGPDVTWHVLADPEGNEFCLLRSTPSQLAALLAAEDAARDAGGADPA
ncbi:MULTISPECIES: VOC family protein [unclassified Cellulomonas]|uniref:VOC family protein n=1 Tax=unclassified Cellulomonas TaxID=2620175 RepID=UPI0024B7066E|nr:VOC family protein [Cellulomonas sp. ES6]WHP18201.1 VOC family protein [Cellulomonas sp. ES6]